MKSIHPIQELEIDKDGLTIRFRSNKIVRYLLDKGPDNLNALAVMNFPEEDWEQFAQLIGYSIEGFAELPYVSNKTFEKAEKKAKKLEKKLKKSKRKELKEWERKAKTKDQALKD